MVIVLSMPTNAKLSINSTDFSILYLIKNIVVKKIVNKAYRKDIIKRKFSV
jgi:hypothetical protein